MLVGIVSLFVPKLRDNLPNNFQFIVICRLSGINRTKSVQGNKDMLFVKLQINNVFIILICSLPVHNRYLSYDN